VRQHLIAAGAGLLAGVAGALLVGRCAAPAARDAAQPEVRRELQAAVVPPGWDRAVDERMTSLEAEVAQQRIALERSARPEGEQAAGGRGGDRPPSVGREERRRVEYAKQLAQRQESIAAHAQEPIDGPWASLESEQLAQRLEAFEYEPRPDVNEVDCRSKTCVASLGFRSPMDGLAFIQSGSIPVTENCSGYIATPVPPENDGEYTLDVIYTCR
jgi:hypothetical protein